MNNNYKLQLYGVAEIRNIESLAIQNSISEKELMFRAGNGVLLEIRKRWSKARKIVVICGKGNNAGDGYVVASLAKQVGLDVKILALAPEEELMDETRNAALECKSLDIPIKVFVKHELENGDLIVDAIFGIGYSGDMSEEYVRVIEAINNSGLSVISVDVPSGIDAESGYIGQCVVKADMTVTMIGEKIGLYLGKARDYSGKILLNTLSLPANLYESSVALVEKLDLVQELEGLPIRKASSHKGDFGHLLVIGGDYGMGGAVRIAAEAALRSGAGLVSVATRKENVIPINATRPEIMAYGIDIDNISQLDSLLVKATVVILGPGLGIGKWSKVMFETAMRANKLMVIDADGLNILGGENYGPRENWVLTPHPGEAGRLLDVSSDEVQKDRLGCLNQLKNKYGGICVLKGCNSLIVSQNFEKIIVCDYGNAGMATGGMGDCLAGVIGGLLAQKIDLFSAVRLGVAVHAKAGDLTALKEGSIGIAALDLLPWIRKLLSRETVVFEN